MGRGQVVRHQVLVLAFGGSNPSAPAKYNSPSGGFFASRTHLNPVNAIVKTTNWGYIWPIVLLGKN